MNRRSFFAMFALGLCARPKVAAAKMVNGTWRDSTLAHMAITLEAQKLRYLGEASGLVYKHISEAYEVLRKARESIKKVT